MYITFKAYKEIVNKVSNNLPESGGILGGYNNVIHYVEFDEGIQLQNYQKCHYSPDVEYLNECIWDWNKKKIQFYGIFHTHFFGVSKLSEGDKQYIKRIMQSMPDLKKKLYFPIVVLPERRIVSYVCRKFEGKFRIEEDNIHFVKTMRR